MRPFPVSEKEIFVRWQKRQARNKRFLVAFLSFLLSTFGAGVACATVFVTLEGIGVGSVLTWIVSGAAALVMGTLLTDIFAEEVKKNRS